MVKQQEMGPNQKDLRPFHLFEDRLPFKFKFTLNIFDGVLATQGRRNDNSPLAQQHSDIDRIFAIGPLLYVSNYWTK